MGSRTIKPLQLGNALNDILAEFDKTSKAKANKGLRVAIVKTWGDIIEDTPIGITGTDGKTRGSWFIGRSVTKKLGRRNKTKGRTYVRNQTAKIDLLRTKIFLYNNSPNINMLEYGGYVKNPKKGTFNKNTRKFEIRSAGGFSKQAPKGMARKNVLMWRTNLKNSFRAL